MFKEGNLARPAIRLRQRIGVLGGAVAMAIGLPSAAGAQNGSLLQTAVPIQHASAMGSSQTAASLASQARLAAQAGSAPQVTLSPPPGAASGSPPQEFPPRSAYGSGAVGLSEASWTYVPPPPVRSYQKHDIVTIRVDELSRMQAEGNAENRRNGLYDAVLKDWIALKGIDGIGPSAQSDGDPRVQGTVSQLYRADASIETRESLTFNIAARIVDIRPNGDLVLEARKTILVNGNAWETALSGICRASDIAPDNVVLSRDLLDLEIRKEDRGRLRDGYRRGWFTRWFDTFSPF